MTDNSILAWEQISSKAVAASLNRLNKISAGRWALAKTSEPVSLKEDYDSTCVYFEVKKESDKMNFALFFNRKDIKTISKCFIGYSFFVSETTQKIEELLISEIANMLLNSIISSLCNNLKIYLIPSIPKVIQTDKKFALKTISEDFSENKDKTILAKRIDIDCDGEKASCEIFSFVPDNILTLIKKAG